MLKSHASPGACEAFYQNALNQDIRSATQGTAPRIALLPSCSILFLLLLVKPILSSPCGASSIKPISAR